MLEEEKKKKTTFFFHSKSPFNLLLHFLTSLVLFVYFFCQNKLSEYFYDIASIYMEKKT